MKIKNLVFAGALAAAVLAPISAMAAERGDKSLGIFGALIFSDTGDTYTAYFNWGQFISDNIELGVDYSLSYTGGDNEMTTQSIGVSGNYFIPTKGKFVPYIGAGANITLLAYDQTSSQTICSGLTCTTITTTETVTDNSTQMVGRVGFRIPAIISYIWII